MKRKKKAKKINPPRRAKDVPATAGMLYEMEQRLTHRMDSRFSKIESELHRVALLVEEQNARNIYVLDGYAQIYDLIDSRR